MKQIDEKILNYCGIYKSQELTEKQKKEVLKLKKELEELTKMKIEKVYIYGKNYWGKDANSENAIHEVCFLVDERLESIDEIWHIIEEHCVHRSILFWSLCQFEKRKQWQGELDYYISNYGNLIYDSGKEPEIDERVDTTHYAGMMSYFKEFRKYYKGNEDDIFMYRLLEIYLLKIGYYVGEPALSFEKMIEYVNYVSEDEKVKLILKNYIEENIDKRKKMCEDFEKYIKAVKQVKMQYKLTNEPTMKVYEKKKAEFERNGVLDIKTLTKEELYIMYVLEGKLPVNIAELYGVDKQVINNKRKNIKLKEAIITPEMIKDMQEKEIFQNKARLYIDLRETGLLSFEECTYNMLKFMKTGEKYLLKEFWKFTEFKITEIEKIYLGDNSTTWYRATLAMEFLKGNDLVEEIDFKKYRVTKKGREVIQKLEYRREKKIDLLSLISIFGEANLFGINYVREDKIEIQREYDKSKGLYDEYKKILEKKKIQKKCKKS